MPAGNAVQRVTNSILELSRTLSPRHRLQAANRVINDVALELPAEAPEPITVGEPPASPTQRKISAAARKRMAEAAKRRWAEQKKKSGMIGKAGNKKLAKPKTMTAGA